MFVSGENFIMNNITFTHCPYCMGTMFLGSNMCDVCKSKENKLNINCLGTYKYCNICFSEMVQGRIGNELWVECLKCKVSFPDDPKNYLTQFQIDFKNNLKKYNEKVQEPHVCKCCFKNIPESNMFFRNKTQDWICMNCDYDIKENERLNSKEKTEITDSGQHLVSNGSLKTGVKCWCCGCVDFPDKMIYLLGGSYECKKCNQEGEMQEKVNHPSHYAGKKFEVIEIIDDFDLDFSLGNAIKYILRAGKKGSKVEDLKKAVWYLQHNIAALEMSNDNQSKNNKP